MFLYILTHPIDFTIQIQTKLFYFIIQLRCTQTITIYNVSYSFNLFPYISKIFIRFISSFYICSCCTYL
eukprot:UN02310